MRLLYPYRENRIRENRIRENILDLLGPTDNPDMRGRIGPYEIIGLLGQGRFRV